MPSSHGIHYFVSGADLHLIPPVILLHGAGGTHLYWPPQLRRIPGRRILALDLPGHGKSDGSGRQSIDAYVDDVDAFIRSIGLNTVVLAGHSMGGAIAIELAGRYPGRVLGLCLVSTGAKLRVSPEILSGTDDPAAFSATVTRIVDLSFAADASPRLKQLAAQRMRETRSSVLHGDFLACNAFDASPRVSGLDMPTLVVCGEQDRMTPPHSSHWLRSHIAGSRLELVPHAGHMVMLEQPDAVTALLDQFLDRLEYRPGA
ncbi:MAG: alpha/beta fold hydrolase [Anaerolineales bacterium]